jgi:hypothetical protein
MLVLAVIPFASLPACSSSQGGAAGDAGSTVLSSEARLSPDTASVEVNQTVVLSPDLIQKVRHPDGKIWTYSSPDISKFDWSVLEPGGGTIEADGYSGMRKLYRAPSSPGVFHVQIAYKEDPSVTDTSTITVTAQPPCPTDYQAADGTPCTAEGRQCQTGDCSNPVCLFSYADAGSTPPICTMLLCESDQWRYARFWLDLSCANPDAGDGGSTDAGSGDAADTGSGDPSDANVADGSQE